jgi:D-3-phosphoglycerate dehydrogenase / 2-oxoglutarate reductase
MKILILSPVAAEAVQRLKRNHDVVMAVGVPTAALPSLIQDREVLVFRSGVDVSADLMGAAPDLKLLIRAGSGTDNIDMVHLAGRGLELVRVPEPGARAVAELTFGLMLCLARKVLWADAMWRRGHWVKNESSGYLLRGKVLGIVGAGSIGATVGELGSAWGMEAIGCVSRPSATAERRLRSCGIRLALFEEVVENADFLSIHVPLLPETRGMIDAAVLRRVKPGSFLINMSRGGVVDEQALRGALLADTRLRGAALDVHATEGSGNISPLAGLDNVILTPHIGSTTVDTQREIGERVVEITNHFAAALAPTMQPETA